MAQVEASRTIAFTRPRYARGFFEALVTDNLDLGRPYTAAGAEKARVAAGASTMRKMEPGWAYTMEFRADRLTLRVDARGIVTSAACG